jgi:hypothetical protein
MLHLLYPPFLSYTNLLAFFKGSRYNEAIKGRGVIHMSSNYDAGIYNNLKMENGQFGLKVVSNATPLTDFSVNGNKEWFYGVVTCLQAAVVTLKIRTANSAPGTDASIANLSMTVGQTIKGKFDLVTVVSGSVLVHYGKDERANL